MSEIVPTYLLDNPDEAIPMNRDEFYDEQIKMFQQKGKPTRAVGIIQILLFTPEGQLILQKRSAKKRHNPGLIDKTIGGHILFGDSPLYTAMYEMLQELQVPSIVLPDKDEFFKAYKLLKDYLSTAALVYFVDSKITHLSKVFADAADIKIANKYSFYLGVYAGSIRPADQEASGILFSSLDELQNEIEKNNDAYTDDLAFFLDTYSTKISEFLSFLAIL